MSSHSLPLAYENRGKLRQTHIIRDLSKIADLVELCFHKNMDSEGQQYVQQMRDASNNRHYLQRVSSSMPMLGYVWEDENKIVGNISIVPFGKGNFLLANIAVHPDYRRRGIARQLTERGMQHVRERNAKSIWLHVEENNNAAIQLYLSLGFQGKALRTVWNANADLLPQPKAKNPLITTKGSHFWEENRQWLARSYPENLRWYRMPDFQIFRPGLKYWLYRIFVEHDVRQWAIQKDGKPQALLNWIPTHARRSPLWLATTPQADTASLAELLQYARLQLLSQRTQLYIDYPARQHVAAFTQAGFTAQRTLLWMRAPGKLP